MSGASSESGVENEAGRWAPIGRKLLHVNDFYGTDFRPLKESLEYWYRNEKNAQRDANTARWL